MAAHRGGEAAALIIAGRAGMKERTCASCAVGGVDRSPQESAVGNGEYTSHLSGTLLDD